MTAVEGFLKAVDGITEVPTKEVKKLRRIYSAEETNKKRPTSKVTGRRVKRQRST